MCCRGDNFDDLPFEIGSYMETLRLCAIIYYQNTHIRYEIPLQMLLSQTVITDVAKIRLTHYINTQ